MRAITFVGVFFVRAFSVLLCILLLGCGTADKHYRLTGRVISKEPGTHTLVVDHDDVPGFMPAMTMPYPVAETVNLAAIEPGDRIRARVVVKPNHNYWLDQISVTDTSQRGKVVSAPAKELYPGEPIPDLELTNQDGKAVRLSDFRGKTLLLTFIYTRCPMPTFCPRISSLFAAIHRELAKDAQELDRTRLLSISIDPQYDTPAVLRKYGLAYLNEDPGGFTHWQFTTPSPENLRKLADAFGLMYEEEDNQISHTMSTDLIGPDGKLVKEWTASDWSTAEVVSAIRQVEHAGH